LTLLVYGMAIASGFAVAVLGPAMPALRDDLVISRTVGGLHFTALAGGAVVTGFTVPRLTQRLGRHTVFWLGGSGIAVGSIIIAVGQHPGVTIAGALVTGMSGAAMLSVGQASLSDHHPDTRSVILTEVHASTSFGSVLPALVVGGLVAVGVGWRPGLAAPVIAIAALAIVARGVAFPQRSGGAEPDTRTPLPRAYWFFWAAFIPSVGAEWSIGAWGAGYLVDLVGATPAAAALLMVSFFGAIALGRFIGARIALRVRPFGLLVGSAIVALGGFLVIVGSSDVAPVVAGLFLAGLGISVSFPLLLTMAMGTVPHRSDEASARTFISAGASVALAPLVLGALADRVGLRTALWLVPALLVLLIALASGGRRASAERSGDVTIPS
jgi:fucose permease